MSSININSLSESINNKADRDLRNLSSPEGENHFSNPALTNSPYTTNRILEIPQDIKLELNNGTLTLKAGSKVYVPNGFKEDGTTPKFDVVTTTQDYIANGSSQELSNIQYYLVLDNTTRQVLGAGRGASAQISSGTTPPTSGIFYNTSTNNCNIYNSGSITYALSFPICVGTDTTTSLGTGYIKSVDQIFNGFGYVGTTAFILPGVKVTLPDGLNDDGTFKNQIRTTASVKVSNGIHYNISSGIFRGSIVISPTYVGRSWKYMTCSSRYTIPPATNGYILSENKTFQTDSSGDITSSLTTGTRVCCLVDYTFTDGVITEWKPHFIDSVANSNMSNISNAGKSFIASMGMPSSKYENWTLGASGTTYIAPSNGYMLLRRVSTGVGQYVVGMDTNKNNYYDIGWSSANGQNLCAIVPCLKGAIIQFDYSAPTAVQFRFIYAEGEN